MKRPSRNPSKLSESIHHQLNMYALAASAAGVGVLALVQPSEAKIVYTETHVVIGRNHGYELDLNHDGAIDFIIDNSYRCTSGNCGYYSLIVEWPNRVNLVAGYYIGNFPFFSALKRGARIGPHARFKKHFGWMVRVQHSQGGHSSVFGSWLNTKSRYLGLKFDIMGKTHYAWARFNVTVQKTTIVAVLTGYAYETVPGKAIIAGATKESDDSEPTASFNTRIPEPATLGMLALGSPGLSVWRRKEQAESSR
jgi:hypothetical protein